MTTETLTIDDMTEAAQHLAKTQRGRNAMKVLLKWLDDDGLGLSDDNQIAVLQLLEGAWGPFAGSARDAMRGALKK
jgi:hypothetical protein